MSSRCKFVGALGISKKVIAVGVCSTSDKPIRKKQKVDILRGTTNIDEILFLFSKI